MKWFVIIPYRMFIVMSPSYMMYNIIESKYYLQPHSESLIFMIILLMCYVPSLFHVNHFDGKIYWVGF